MILRSRRVLVAVVVALVATSATGCSDSKSFCAVMREPRREFRVGGDTDAQHRGQIDVLDSMIAQLATNPAHDDLVAVHDYAELLYGLKQFAPGTDKEQQQLMITKRFFGGASQRLDQRLRTECKVDLGENASPFALIAAKGDE